LAFSYRSFSNFFLILLTAPFTLFLALLYSYLIGWSLLLATFFDRVFSGAI
jgi:multidrug efflux pump subunit AcrB